jgi:hypothetical protein
MSRPVLYMAHPLAPTAEQLAAIPYETVRRMTGEYEPDEVSPISDSDRMAMAIDRNIKRALRWLAWLRASFPETTFIAPWIATVQSRGNLATPEMRQAGLVDDCAVVERCDGIVLVGGRRSSGMQRELEHGRSIPMTEERPNYFEEYDLTWLGVEPVDLGELSPSGKLSFERWHSAILHGRPT